jgi:hypothetical protein
MPLSPLLVHPGRQHSVERAPRPCCSATESANRQSSTHSRRTVGARLGCWISLTGERTLEKHELIPVLSAADLIVKSCHPIGRAGPTAVRNAVLVLKTAHLVFRGGIGGTLRTSLSLGLRARKFVCEYFTSRFGDRKGRTRIAASRSRAMALTTLSVHKRWQLVPTGQSCFRRKRRKRARPGERRKRDGQDVVGLRT